MASCSSLAAALRTAQTESSGLGVRGLVPGSLAGELLSLEHSANLRRGCARAVNVCVAGRRLSQARADSLHAHSRVTPPWKRCSWRPDTANRSRT
ncbi:hypothetical protein Y1Q_0016254 [Alligator mississippiensis]|uniref:Uncharacterized protein n=1 Tax=Alligator mississippiensis TaxID=8496 RepID=A0A151MVZ9_ALLMI|nr:hypothetical protein Y1Q_0016254 [Alligator mississippiensis]